MGVVPPEVKFILDTNQEFARDRSDLLIKNPTEYANQLIQRISDRGISHGVLLIDLPTVDVLEFTVTELRKCKFDIPISAIVGTPDGTTVQLAFAKKDEN